ncbi:hypothetical protein [Falsibacillus albus]|uniref:Uncharacterized protein n=1 Tax=Falsibacillus albus TaxID=2478915 RepID=A0A3L7K184_9BACI|nr:hypothetical protein [Falsibacillus albus]RLQ95721.1 hypothetical protein D9X91_08835 [Falsibacillus albus]
MSGSFVWNLWFAIIGFTFYFILSFPSHLPRAVMIGSIISGFIFFITAFIIRWAIAFILKESKDGLPQDVGNHYEDLQYLQTGHENSGEIDSEETARIIQSLLKE